MTDSFALAAGPQRVLERLVRDRGEFGHLTDARIACAFSREVPMLRGAPCAAFIAQPAVQGPLRPWFEWAVDTFTAPLFDGEPADYLVLFHAEL